MRSRFESKYISALVFAAATRQVDELLAHLYSVVHEDPVDCRRPEIIGKKHCSAAVCKLCTAIDYRVHGGKLTAEVTGRCRSILQGGLEIPCTFMALYGN